MWPSTSMELGLGGSSDTTHMLSWGPCLEGRGFRPTPPPPPPELLSLSHIPCSLAQVRPDGQPQAIGSGVYPKRTPTPKQFIDFSVSCVSGSQRHSVCLKTDRRSLGGSV